MRNLPRAFTALCLGLCLSFVVAASDYINIEQRLSAEQMRATGLDKLTREQLQLLNSLLREESVKVVEAEAERRDAIERETAVMALDEKPIKSRLVGSVNGWEPGTVFELENGQRWKVLKGHMKLRKPLQAPEILLVSGLAGRWFLQVHEDFPKARVYRID